MELSPEEYGAYWQAAIRIAAGGLIVYFGVQFTSALLDHRALGAQALGFILLVGIVFVGCFVATLGLARLIRTAIRAERG